MEPIEMDLEGVEVRLDSLPIGSSFLLHLDTTGRDIRGKLLRLSNGSATVKLDSGGEYRTFVRTNPITGQDETVRIPIPSEVTHWSLGTQVIPVGTIEEKKEEEE